MQTSNGRKALFYFLERPGVVVASVGTLLVVVEMLFGGCGDTFVVLKMILWFLDVLFVVVVA